MILPPLKAQRGAQGGFVLTRKYMEGVAAFAKGWPGPVTSLVEMTQTRSTDMDHVEYAGDDPVTPIEARPDPAALPARLRDAALVVTFLSSAERALVDLCRDIAVPLVFWAEYSPRTEAQILEAETKNPLRRLRGRHWLRNATRVRRKMVADAAGLQCSGLPVFDAYAAQSPNAITFWDSRVCAAEVVTEADLHARAAHLAKGDPLRLAFGGRLIEMKGVQYLPPFAQALRDLEVPFTLDIYGTGPLQAALQSQIAACGLGDQVTLKGALDFRSAWLPTLKQTVDVFICPHPQGDPSSTYPETMSCGLPTLGFDNEAFASVAKVADCGWAVPVGDTAALARQVQVLDQGRDQIVAHARRGRDFAVAHCFEETAARRVAHFLSLARL